MCIRDSFNALLKSREGIGARRLAESLDGLVKGGILITEDVPGHRQKRRYRLRKQVVSGIAYYLALLASIGLSVVDDKHGRDLINRCRELQPNLDFMTNLYTPQGGLTSVSPGRMFTAGPKIPVCAIDAAARVFCDPRDMTVLKDLLMEPNRPKAEIRRKQESMSPRRWQIGLDRLVKKWLVVDESHPFYGFDSVYAPTPLGSNAIVLFAAVATVLHQLLGKDGLIDPLHRSLFTTTSSRAEDWARIVARRDRLAREADGI